LVRKVVQSLCNERKYIGGSPKKEPTSFKRTTARGRCESRLEVLLGVNDGKRKIKKFFSGLSIIEIHEGEDRRSEEK